ncbi:prominin-1-A-like, partial [Saccoglossus kowalevskii]
DDMKTKLADHKVDAGNIDSDVTSTITDGNAADQFIQDELSGIISEQVDNYFERIMSYLGQFVAYIKRMLEEDLAKCRPLANFINNIFNTICRDFLDPFNGFWFVNGWCVFFFMPSIIFGVKLAKFLRKMKEDDSFDDGMEMKSMPPSNGAGPPFSNKVGSGNV